jgi:hypothetical protein
MADTKKRRAVKPQAAPEPAQPDEYHHDLHPHTMAGRNIGAAGAHPETHVFAIGQIAILRQMATGSARCHAGALVPSNETPPSAVSATVQTIFVPPLNAARYLPPRWPAAVVSSSKASDSRAPLEPNFRWPKSRKN